MKQHIFQMKEEDFQLRDWGGYLCFLGDEKSVGSQYFKVTAVVRMDKLIHEPHVHDDSDEIFYVLRGQGKQLLRNEDGSDTVYDIKPGDTVFLTKNRWHGTSNYEHTRQLDMLLINYFYDGQSDKKIEGVVLRGSVIPVKTDYGRYEPVITPKLCGTQTVCGEVLTILPGRRLKQSVEAKEELVYNITDSVMLEIENEGEVVFSKDSEAFFFKGENYCLRNRNSEPVRLFRLRAL